MSCRHRQIILSFFWIATSRGCRRVWTGQRLFSSAASDNTNGWIRTLNQSLLVEEKQEILDISGLTNPAFSVRSMADTYSVPISYNLRWRKREEGEEGKTTGSRVPPSTLPVPNETHNPFPPNTIGVFYFHSSASMHPLTDSIRFRLCNNPSEFHKGTDLLVPFCVSSPASSSNELPWSLPLWRITWHKEMEGLRRLLRSEDLVPPTFLENNEVLEELNRVGTEVNPLFALRQPFVLDVNRWSHRLQLVTRTRIDTFKINHLFTDPSLKQPYKGLILVRFELMRPYLRKQFLQMRILEHLSPVTSTIPNYARSRKRRIPTLQPGTLVSKRSKLGKVTKPWTYQLDTRKYGDVWKRFLKHSPG